jgi:hypothetical protein
MMSKTHRASKEEKKKPHLDKKAKKAAKMGKRIPAYLEG